MYTLLTSDHPIVNINLMMQMTHDSISLFPVLLERWPGHDSFGRGRRCGRPLETVRLCRNVPLMLNGVTSPRHGMSAGVRNCELGWCLPHETISARNNHKKVPRRPRETIPNNCYPTPVPLPGGGPPGQHKLYHYLLSDTIPCQAPLFSKWKQADGPEATLSTTPSTDVQSARI